MPTWVAERMEHMRRWAPADIARASGALLCLVTIAAVVWALFFSEVDSPLPGIALGSELVLRFERALGVILLLGAPIVLAAPLIAGRLPRSVSKEGIDYEQIAEIDEQRLQRLETALGQARELTYTVGEAVLAQNERLERLESRGGD